MKIVFFGDIRGSIYDLNKILKKIENENPSYIYCIDDVFNPFLGIK